jgi:hypothetical protein
MPDSITHLVAGEHVLLQNYANLPVEMQGAFLAGCMLVDVHGFNAIDRRQTHFVGRVEEDGEAAFRQSCSNFLGKMDRLLRRPWEILEPVERSFTGGYLCHLAVDECWKKLGWELFQKFGITSWDDFVVPADVSVTAFDFLSRALWIDPPQLERMLENIIVPDIFTHVPYELFRKQWCIIRGYVTAGGTAEAYIKMLERAGRSSDETEAIRQRYDTYWENGIGFVHEIGGVEPFLAGAVERTMEVLPQLMER